MENQICRFCEKADSILTRETCCSGCSKIPDAYQPERLNPEDTNLGTSPVDPKTAHWRFKGDGTPYIHICDSLNSENK